MARRYVMLARLSAEGVRTLKENPSRIKEVNREVEGMGARVVEQHALLGPYDFITVLEAPDPETVARVSVELASRKTATYETLTAISVDDFISALGPGVQPTRAEEVPPTRAEEAPPPRTAGIEEGVLGRTEGAPPRTGEAPDTERISPTTERTVPPRTQDAPMAEEVPSGTPPQAPPGDVQRGTSPEPPPTRTREVPPTGQERSRQTEREREEDKGLVDRVREALSGEEEPRRREETDRPDRR